jgi:hypothetical protein
MKDMGWENSSNYRKDLMKGRKIMAQHFATPAVRPVQPSQAVAAFHQVEMNCCPSLKDPLQAPIIPCMGLCHSQQHIRLHMGTWMTPVLKPLTLEPAPLSAVLGYGHLEALCPNPPHHSPEGPIVRARAEPAKTKADLVRVDKSIQKLLG